MCVIARVLMCVYVLRVRVRMLAGLCVSFHEDFYDKQLWMTPAYNVAGVKNASACLACPSGAYSDEVGD
jgi:hypothetical protein